MRGRDFGYWEVRAEDIFLRREEHSKKRKLLVHGPQG